MSVLSQTQTFSVRRELSIGHTIESIWDKFVKHNDDNGLDVQSLDNHKKDDDYDIFNIVPTQMTFEETVADKGFELETH